MSWENAQYLCVCVLDNILIFSPSLQVHVQHVRRVLQRLLENHLFVKAEKCMFCPVCHVSRFGGFGREGSGMDPDKVSCLSLISRSRFSRHASVVCPFLYHFIWDIVVSPPPLTSLTLSKTRFWLVQGCTGCVRSAQGAVYLRSHHHQLLIQRNNLLLRLMLPTSGWEPSYHTRSSLDDKVHPCAFYCGSLESFTYLLTIFFFWRRRKKEKNWSF